MRKNIQRKTTHSISGGELMDSKSLRVTQAERDALRGRFPADFSFIRRAKQKAAIC